MLDGEHELLALTVQRESGINPCEEIPRAAQVLAAASSAAVLARVVDDGDGEVVSALQFA